MKRLLIPVLLLAVGGCASRQTKPEDLKKKIDAAMEREFQPLPGRDVASSDGFFTAKMEGTGRPSVVSQEGFYQAAAPVGTQSPMLCYVYQQELDSANALRGMLGELMKTFPTRKIVGFEAGMLGKTPYLYLEQMYVFGKKVGIVKGLAAALPDNTVVCLHDEMGYRKSFKRAVGTFVNSMSFPGSSAPEPAYTAVMIAKVNDNAFGFSRASFYEKPGEGSLVTRITALLMPRTPTELIAVDETAVEISGRKGRIAEGSYAASENGRAVRAINLKRMKGDNYSVNGQFMGKQIATTFKARKGLDGAYRSLFLTRRMLRSKKRRKRGLTMKSYVPAASPLKPMTVSVKATGKEFEGRPEFETTMGTLKTRSTFDEKGMAVSVLVPMGHLQMRMDRAYEEGGI